VRIGIGIPNQVRDIDPTVIPRWALLAEEAGFSTLGTVGRFAYPGVGDTVALSAAAAVTSRIGLMSNVMLTATWPGILLAKELAGIDGMSGGRLTLGIGVGDRPDDFVVEGCGLAGRGERIDRDLETFREVWSGKPVGGGTNAAVPSGTRQIPLLFGARSAPAMARMARWGEGYIGGSFPAALVAPSFETARQAWRQAGRDGEPRLVALAYFSLVDAEHGRANVHDYYSGRSSEMADLVAGGVATSAEEVKKVVAAFADLGVDDIVLNPATAALDEIERVADVIL
jgi:alkanesulfonate monooxygenase SsuD/methylene tetrahydromethanopterin reductase-like flavin-dependent oxidoreductase (luciferase family)